MDFNFNELTEIASAVELADAQSIKQALPIAYVLSHYGTDIATAGEDKLMAFCPFHKDGQETTASFSVFSENFTRWGCWACADQGDVIDLIQKFEPELSFIEACDKARELYSEMEDSDWTGPTETKPRKEPPSPEDVQRVIERSKENVKIELIEELIAVKRKKDGPDSNRFPASFLVEQFDIGTWGNWIVIPYYDMDGGLSTFKHRTPTRPPFSLDGAKFDELVYNGWRTDMLDADIFICEGESDTWNAQYEIGDTYRVLGIPTGAGSRLAKLIQSGMFKNKTVYLALDMDEAGRKGIRKLAASLTAAGANVRIVPLAKGKDVSASAGHLRSLVSRARSIVEPPSGLRVTDGGYVRANSEAATPISNFIFEPTRELIGPDGVAYEGVLKPGGEEVILSSYDLSSKNRVVGWAMRHGRSWYGSDRDAVILLGMLQAEGVWLPVGRMATVAGLHEGHFVWPGGVIGEDHWKFVPPTADSHLEDDIKIKPGSWSPDYIHTLRSIHKRNITDPILAWLAIAPFRSLLKEFPILAISGPHGSGKTRTLETILRGFTGTYIANTLTGTTPHAVVSSFAATNGFPEVFEEYRNGARDDAKIVFQQLARDSYTQQKSQKGGMKGNWAELTSIIPTAPVIVSGEDMFTEGSHVERMIMLQMYRDGMNIDTFAKANSWRNNGLPYAYLTWLHKSLQDGTFASMVVEPAGPADLSQRQRINIGILNLGWKLLQMFMEDADDSLGPPQFQMVVDELREANEHTPIEDAMHWCLGEVDAGGIVMVGKDGMVKIKVENFVSFIQEKKKRGDLSFTLPGGAKSIEKYLKLKYSAVEKTETIGPLIQTYLVFEFSKIAR
jgi:hypothetical protein